MPASCRRFAGSCLICQRRSTSRPSRPAAIVDQPAGVHRAGHPGPADPAGPGGPALGDESTLLLTEYLAAHVQQLAVLIVGTYRDDEVGRAHPLARVVGQLTRRRLGSRIALQRLAEDQVGAMLRGLADDEPPQELVRAIDAETEGNPFFVEEVFLHLVESGVLVDQDGRFRRDLRIDELDVPDSIRLVIGERLGRLSRTTRRVLTAGALLAASLRRRSSSTCPGSSPTRSPTPLRRRNRRA